jgi:hypothetical protein
MYWQETIHEINGQTIYITHIPFWATPEYQLYEARALMELYYPKNNTSPPTVNKTECQTQNDIYNPKTTVTSLLDKILLDNKPNDTLKRKYDGEDEDENTKKAKF